MNTYDESLEWIQLQAQIEANALKEFALRPIPLLTIKSDAVKTEAGTVNFLTVRRSEIPRYIEGYLHSFIGGCAH